MRKLILLFVLGQAAITTQNSVAQTCSGKIPILYPDSTTSGNTCGLHPEITSACGVTLNGKGVSVFRVPLDSDHGDIWIKGDSPSFSTAYFGLTESFNDSPCAFGICFDNYHSDDENFPNWYHIPPAQPSGYYYFFVGDFGSDTPGCGDFSITVTGDYGLSEQAVHFTSIRPTNAIAGGTYTVTAVSDEFLPVYLDIDSDSSTSGCTISGSSSGSTVAFNHPGKCVIRANQDGTAQYYPALQVTQSFDVKVGLPARVEFDQPSLPNGIAGMPISTPIKINELDAFGNLETGDSVSIISLVATGPGHLQAEPVTMALSNGVATFSDDLILDSAGTYTLTAASNAVGTTTGISEKFSIMPSAAGAMLKFESPIPSTIEQGQTLGSVTVTETDQFGNQMAFDSSTMVSLHASSCGGLSLESAPLTGGQVTFNTTQPFHTMSDDITLTAEPTSMSGPVSATAHFGVTANPDFIFFSGEESCEP